MTSDSTRADTGHIVHPTEYTQVKHASIRGAGVGIVTLIVKAIVDLGSIVVLARLLTPADFGLVAMAGTVLNLLRIVGDWGLVMASTQRPQLTADQLSTLFWINVGGGTSLALLAVVCAPILVVVFDDPRITSVAAVLSITLVAIGVGAQHEAILRRRLSYGRLHVLDVASQAIGLLVGVVLALTGIGYWSLVLYQVVARVVRTCWLCIGTRWIPGRPRRGIGVLPILRYGGELMPIQILAHLSRSVGDVIVGATAGASELGIYRRAHGIVMMAEQLKQPLKSMIPSSLSRLQHQPADFSRFYLNALSIWAMIACAAIGYVSLEAPFVVRLLLGDRWLSAVPLVRALAAAGVATALGAATEWMLLPLADLKRLIGMRVLRASVILVGVLLGWRGGVPGIALGYSVAACVSLSIELFFVTSGKEVSFWSLSGAFARPIAATAVASTILVLIPDNVSFGVHLIELVMYLSIYLAVQAILPGGRLVISSVLRTARQVILQRHAT